MPRQPSGNVFQIALKIPAQTVDRADRLIAWVGRTGIAATRTDVIRIALDRGLESLETECGTETKRPRRTIPPRA